MSLLRAHNGFRASLDLIVPGFFGGTTTVLLFYDRSAGTGEFYAVNAVGDMSLLRAYNTFRTSWDLIVPGYFSINAFPGTPDQTVNDLLFYDRAVGQAEFYHVTRQTDMTLLQAHDTFRKSGISSSLMNSPTAPVTSFSTTGLLVMVSSTTRTKKVAFHCDNRLIGSAQAGV
jgi:hypothetical protein